MVRRMALITEFERIDRRISYRSTTRCGWTVGQSRGQRLIHLETYGSQDRSIPDKGSQFLQLDESAATQLLAIIREAFPAL